MDQPPDYTRRRIAVATCALALLALANRPDPTPIVGSIAITASDDAPLDIRAAAAPLAVGAIAFVEWATKRLMR